MHGSFGLVWLVDAVGSTTSDRSRLWKGRKEEEDHGFPSTFLGWGVAPLYRTCFLVHCVEKRVKSYFASLFFVQHNVFLDVFTTNRMQGAVFLMLETTIVF